ncbi:MAG: hypothetical protein QXP36_14100 [Conexivisphaerales archaeon]
MTKIGSKITLKDFIAILVSMGFSDAPISSYSFLYNKKDGLIYVSDWNENFDKNDFVVLKTINGYLLHPSVINSLYGSYDFSKLEESLGDFLIESGVAEIMYADLLKTIDKVKSSERTR